MKKYFSTEEFNKAKTNDMLPLECYYCSEHFNVKKHRIIRIDSGNLPSYAHRFCSKTCANEYKRQKMNISLCCKHCGIMFIKRKSHIKNPEKSFCSKTCATSFNNTHKTVGVRRSKLEIWVEQKLSALFNFEIQFNQKDAINSELDIFIPSLRLAFELNGIFHYEPIYGELVLSKIQSNDNRKFQACLERGIEFCIIDTSKQIYFTEKTAQLYLDIILSVIHKKMEVIVGIEPTTGTLQKCCSTS